MKFIPLLLTTLLSSQVIYAQVSDNKSTFCANCKIDLSPATLIKTWSVSTIKPSSLSTHDDAISILEITQKKNVNSYSGMISFGNWNGMNNVTDSCRLNFFENDLQIISGSHTWSGKVYKANSDSLVFGLTGQFMYYFVKINKIKQVVTPKDTVKTDLRSESLLHNWSVYKVESQPGTIKPGIGLLKGLKFIEYTGKLQYKGSLVFDIDGKRKTQDCTIAFITDSPGYATKIFINTEGQSWFMEFSKADGKEMIMGNKAVDGIRYFLKIKL